MEIIVILLAFFIATIFSFFQRDRLVIEILSLMASTIAFFCSIIIAFKVSMYGTYTPFYLVSVDQLGEIVIFIIGIVGLTATIYSIPYLRVETAKDIIGFSRVKQFFILLNLFLSAMFLAISSSSPIFTWISIEATTLSTALLISFYNKPSTVEAAWKYLIINSIGLLLGFLGTLLYFTSLDSSTGRGLVDWHSLIFNVGHLDPLIAKIAFIFILIGYGTKVGFAPMHTWKPDAYSKAPAPIGALFSGALMPVAFAVILKFKVITDLAVGVQFSQQLLIVFGLLSIAVASILLFVSTRHKRVLAYSSIENAGIIALGIGFGGFGVVAALLQMIYHSLIKSALFFSAGNLLLKYNSSKIAQIRGGLAILPVTSILFIAGFFAVTGTPPFGVFFSKIYILSAGLTNHFPVCILALLFMVILFIGFFKHASEMFFSEEPKDIVAGEMNNWLLVSPIVLMIVVLYLSFFMPPFLSTLLKVAGGHY